MSFLHQVEPLLAGTEAEALADYLGSGGWLTEFKKTEHFAGMLAECTGSTHCHVVTSGTVGLYLALLAAGVGPGDRVIVPNYTMIATPNAVAWTGATPVLVDVDPATLCMDLAAIAEPASATAMLYVSINGRSGDMAAVVDYCARHGLTLIEDAAQALGSRQGGRALGTFGRMGVYSFTPHKIITTGQGGAVVTACDACATKLGKLKDFHRTAPATDEHDGLGFNFKFTDLQAVVGIEQLGQLEERMQAKRRLDGWYREELEGVDGVHLMPRQPEESIPWFMEVLLANEDARNALRAHLKEAGIGSRPFYPPLNHQPMYGADAPAGSLPVSEDMAVRGLWLPSSLGLAREDVARVGTAVRDFCGAGA